MMESESFLKEVSEQLPFALTEDQEKALEAVYRFLFQGGERSVFMLKGYAGTGKTTLSGGLIRWLHTKNRKTVLLAPTGRSAKVLASASGFPASTIHRKIYTIEQTPGGVPFMTLAPNKSEKTIFIVDEASMIGDGQDESGMTRRSLLEDLMEYVYSGVRCRLLLIGDDAQLPPVGLDISPALDPKKVKTMFQVPVFGHVLTQVIRQASDSLVLENATRIRDNIRTKNYNILLRTDTHEDLRDLDAYGLEDELSSAFGRDHGNEAIIVCRSNKQANEFNQQIRQRILFREGELEAGDRLMIVKNNYFWKPPGKRQNFLANGDMITVERVHAITEFGPFRFAECQVFLTDEDAASFDIILMMNSLVFEGASIPSKKLFALREEMIKSGDVNPTDAEEKFFQNPYFQAVQVKYAYAVTCHKSQGGQWPAVFIFLGYFTEEMLDRSFARWLYTALTRSAGKAFLINFPKELIEGGME